MLPFERKEAIEAANANGITRIVTKNVEDFRRIEGVDVIEY